jgi:serine/threonine-protein kinase RsbW
MPVAESLDFRIPSDVQYIEEVVGHVVRRCEALSNAILRGNGEGNARDVSLRIEIDEMQLVAEVRDAGDGFDLGRCTTDATLPENVLREDGRGLFLMQQLMDRVEQFTDRGNVVRLVLIRN